MVTTWSNKLAPLLECARRDAGGEEDRLRRNGWPRFVVLGAAVWEDLPALDHALIPPTMLFV